jgi:hypothetical protein
VHHVECVIADIHLLALGKPAVGACVVHARKRESRRRALDVVEQELVAAALSMIETFRSG